MREDLEKRREILKRLARNLHWHMMLTQHNAVLVVVGIGRILQEIRTPRELQWYETMRLARGVIDPPRIALVLTAEQTFRIARCLRELRLGNIARILLRL